MVNQIPDLDKKRIDDVIVGNATPEAEQGLNIGRVISVGRLDYNTEGLILLTNNGDLARKLELPATKLKRLIPRN